MELRSELWTPPLPGSLAEVDKALGQTSLEPINLICKKCQNSMNNCEYFDDYSTCEELELTSSE
jgi:hypothetical protein